MPNDMSRHELKTNKLAEYVDTAVDWAANNRNTFYASAGAIFGIVLFGIFFLSRLQSSHLRNEEKLSMAQYMVRSNDASQQGQGADMLDAVIRSNASSSAGIRAAIVKADALLRQQNNNQSEITLQNVINNPSGDKKLLPFAYSVLGILYENTGKYAQAIGVYNGFLGKYPDHFLVPRIYESLARVLEISGNIAEAKTTYEKLVTLYPASAWAQNAQERIISISNQLQSSAQAGK